MTTINKPDDAEAFLQEPPRSSDIRSMKPKKDQKDIMVSKLKNVNLKLRNHLKELNNKLEVAINNTHISKKPKRPAREADPEEEQIQLENTRKCIANFKYEIERINKQYNKEELEQKLEESRKRNAELEKKKHDLEVELEDFKEENKIQQPVRDSELKVWNEKIRKKREIVKTEQELFDKRKEKSEMFAQKIQELKQKLQKVETTSEPKMSEDEKRKIKDQIEVRKKEIKMMKQKNKQIIKEKETHLQSSKKEMNDLIDQLEEINKTFKVKQHKINIIDRKVKYGISGGRDSSENQLRQSYASKITSNRANRSQYRVSQYDKSNPGAAYQRDLSAVNSRMIGKNYKKKFKNNSLNSSVDSKEAMKRNNSTNKVPGNKLKSMRKNVKENNASVVYGNNPSKMLDEGKGHKADISVGNIDIKDQKPRKEADNLKAHLTDSKYKVFNIVEKNEKPIEKDLGKLKGLKTAQKQKIETSVNL